MQDAAMLSSSSPINTQTLQENNLIVAMLNRFDYRYYILVPVLVTG